MLFFVKGPAADTTDAPPSWGLLCNPAMKMFSFFVFPSNGAPVEWNWRGKSEVLGEKTCPSATLSTTNPTWTDPGSNPGLRGERPATSRLSHGTAQLVFISSQSPSFAALLLWGAAYRFSMFQTWNLNYTKFNFIFITCVRVHIVIVTAHVRSRIRNLIRPEQHVHHHAKRPLNISVYFKT